MYHINPETGRPNQCKARTKESCKYYNKETNEFPRHFNTKEEAREYYEWMMQDDLFNEPLNKRMSNKVAAEEKNVHVIKKKKKPEEKKPEFGSVENLFVTSEDDRYPLNDSTLRVEEDYGEKTQEGIYSSTLGGELSEPGYFDKKQISGTINYNKLDENSYKRFGFAEIDSEERLSNILKHYSQNLYYEEEKRNVLFENNFYSAKLTYEVETKREILEEYTVRSYTWINRGLYDPELSKKLNKDDVRLAANYYHLTDEKGEQKKYQVNPDPEEELSDDEMKEAFGGVVRSMDSIVDTSNGLQKTAYRGLSSRQSRKYLDVGLGQEIRFDSFGSTSRDMGVASNFLNKSLKDEPGKYDEDPEHVIFEMKTGSGSSISSVSNYPAEREIVLPRGSRFMVVGKHKNKKLGDFKIRSKPLGYNPDTKITLIQLVEINEKGEVVDHNNIEETKKLRREYNNKHSNVKWDN